MQILIADDHELVRNEFRTVPDLQTNGQHRVETGENCLSKAVRT